LIYLAGKSGQHVIILEPANLDKLRAGGFVKTPDDEKSVIIGFAPDIVWTGEQIKVAFDESDNSFAVADLERILREGLSRPEVKERPYHHSEMISKKRERKPQ